jgi:hypothetical protein
MANELSRDALLAIGRGKLEVLCSKIDFHNLASYFIESVFSGPGISARQSRLQNTGTRFPAIPSNYLQR